MSIHSKLNLQGRHALITGGSGHIGRKCAETLAELGSTLTLLDLPGDHLQQTAKDLNAIPIPCDLSNLEEVRSTANSLDNVEIFIHTASLVGTTSIPGWAETIENQTSEIWQKALNVGVASAFEIAQILRPQLAAHNRGSIILFSSIYGQIAPDFRLYEGTSMGNPVGYGVTKGGLIQLCKYLTTTYSPQIRTNIISPGGVARGQNPEFTKRYIDKTPMQRMATEDDLSGAIAFFASDLSLYVSGQDLAVDGGFTAW